jgi:transcription-repair coupling factor (superfamily II helicase)
VNHERVEGTFFDWKRELENSHQLLQDDITSSSILPAPEQLYSMTLPTKNYITLNSFNSANLEQDLKNSMTLKLEPIRPYFLRNFGLITDKHLYLKKIFEYLFEISSKSKIYFCCRSESSKKEISFLLESVTGKINNAEFIDFVNLDGFNYSPDHIYIISDSDLFSKKAEKTSATVKNLDLFAEQIGQLKPGDFVIHSEFGMAKYLGLESMSMGESQSDFLILQFDEGDKVYLPVYKLNLIQKHSDSINNQKLASLRANKFNQVKERARVSAKELAFSLIELQAKRMTAKAHRFSAPDHLFNEFELSFLFQETPDQQSAINLALEKMQSPYPMDLLVCGDVGFGKTEVAMRAAFLAVLDKKQVAVLVPTTILALQHFLTFSERFKNFPVNIDHISRFRTKKECDNIYSDVKEHKIDILIGTHALLSSSVEYNDLGLVIVDEEHRFGVGHKEKLKLIKESVDFLTLTATPIPRTLQLSFLGLRDMSLIQTAPPRRQSIKTYVIKEDPATIKEAIEKELHRGGQVYIVHNRVGDIEIFASKIRELVPQSKIIIGHGQLSEKDLEQRMKSFIQGDYNILIATTIIESGIDIANANTMIIDRADTFGLAQLHQLRGRIGRSDKKAYAYLSVPAFQSIGVDAEKRLKALQTYADIGAGFSLASCDLEIRGAGDILGAQQSGHMEAVGLELYMQLIKEAINELKGSSSVSTKIDIEINTPFAAYIPSSYITDASTRLKQYKSLSNLETLELLDAAEEQYVDIYGAPPIEVTNLFVVLRARLLLSKLNVKSVQIAKKSLILKFNSSALEQNSKLRNQIVDFFIKRPKVYQFTPDYKLIYSRDKEFDLEALLLFSKDIAQQLNLC